MNRGVLAGIEKSAWKSYQPILRAFAYAGHGFPTDVVLGNGTTFGRYLVTPAGLVICQVQITFGSTSTFGSSEDFWGISLPVPASRSNIGADLPLGNGMGWQGAAANPQLCIPLTPTLLDPAQPAANQSVEDYWLQLFCPYVLTFGSGSIASAATSTTITHNLPFTPTAYDIQIMPTAATTNSIIHYYVDTITSTQFNVNVRTAPGASTFAFNWKARAEPVGPNASTGAGGLLMSSKAPWTWAAGHQIAFQAYYEARH